ncbi:hypothetical protein DBV15_08965, partial [Temnothorax longispinosus]
LDRFERDPLVTQATAGTWTEPSEKESTTANERIYQTNIPRQPEDHPFILLNPIVIFERSIFG